jgi:hypothetical protein
MNRRDTMKTKLTMLVVAALAAATVAIGGLAGTPSASASTKRPRTHQTYLVFRFSTVFTTTHPR